MRRSSHGSWWHVPILLAAMLSLALVGLSLATTGVSPASAELRPAWALREAVELRLAASRALAGARIKVETSAERVTLTGDVRDEGQRQRAIRLAAATPGVREVDQQLDVGAGAPVARRPDRDVARDVAQRLASQSAVHAQAAPSWASGWRVDGEEWGVAVDVDDGDVLLEGSVLLQDHLYEFVIAARGVPGVQSVRADVTLRANPAPEDPYHPH